MGDDAHMTMHLLTGLLEGYDDTDVDLHFDCLAMIRNGVELLRGIRQELTIKAQNKLEIWASPWPWLMTPREISDERIGSLVELMLYADNYHGCDNGKGCSCKKVVVSGANCLKDAAKSIQGNQGCESNVDKAEEGDVEVNSGDDPID